MRIVRGGLFLHALRARQGGTRSREKRYGYARGSLLPEGRRHAASGDMAALAAISGENKA